MLTILLQATETLNKVQLSAADASVAKHLTFFDLFLKGGYILIPLVMLSVIAVYLMIDKAIDVHKGTTMDYNSLNTFKKLIKQGKLKEAQQHISNDQTTLGRILQHSISEKPQSEIDKSVETAGNIEVSKLGRNLGYLSLIAGIAPMLGFIGTITGVIKIFYNISITDNISIGIISGGLYEKMISSGTGLFVGVIAFTGYHIITSQIDRYVGKVEEEVFECNNLIQENSK